jgi:hypothetical protein
LEQRVVNWGDLVEVGLPFGKDFQGSFVWLARHHELGHYNGRHNK